MCCRCRIVRLFAFAIATLVWLMAGDARADERKRVALLEFEGPRSADVRGDVMRIAAANAWVVSASHLDGRSVREFADDYELDLVIEGTIAKHDSRYEIRIYFVRGTTGQSLRSVASLVARPALDAEARKRITRELVRVLDSLPAR